MYELLSAITLTAPLRVSGETLFKQEEGEAINDADPLGGSWFPGIRYQILPALSPIPI